MAKLVKSYGNYTLRRKVQSTSLGAIYERDWATVTDMYSTTPGASSVYQSGNFKIVVNTSSNPRKRYGYGNWLKNEGEEFWTLDNTSKIEVKVDTTVLKPNYSSLLDFAHYGSTTELIKASVTDIIEKFPGEIYLSPKQRLVSALEPLIIDGKEWYEVENPFGIDVHTEYKKDTGDFNTNRFLCLSYDRYEVIYKEGEEGETRFDLCWTPYNTNKRCCDDEPEVIYTADFGFTKIYGICIDGQIELLHDGSATGFHIRLKEEYIKEAFEKFDDFERMLLNVDTKPIYKAVLDTPIETDSGVVIYKTDYIWPVVNGWNIDVETIDFKNYVNSLLKIAKFYDEYRTDNIYRALTHESIKNFDWTTPAETNKPELDGELIDEERIPSILRVYGRQFDDIKRYIENIRNTPNLSYSENNNVPDNILNKLLEYDGWDVKNASPSDENKIETLIEYPGKNIKASPEDANLEFMRRLGLNSRNIFSRKGTKEAIREIFSLFGIPEVGSMKYKPGGRWWDENQTNPDFTPEKNTTGYTLHEYNVIASHFPTGEEINKIKSINEKKDGFTESYKESRDPFVGLPVAELGLAAGSDVVTYLVPWIDKDKTYDGNPYFQMFGGWGKRNKKQVDFFLLPDVSELAASAYTASVDFALYDETVKNVNIVSDITSLQILPPSYPKDGDVYYVLDLTSFYKMYPTIEEGSISNYFVFAEKAADSNGVSYNDDMEWQPVAYNDFEMITLSPGDPGYDERRVSNAVRVVYFESINDVALGNNPHNGNRRYDSGAEFFKYFDKIFYNAEQEDNFKTYHAVIQSANVDIHYNNRFLNPNNPQPDVVDVTYTAGDYSFGVMTDNTPNYQEDNDKIWFFLDEDNTNWAGGVLKETTESASAATGERTFEPLDSESEFTFDKQHKDSGFSPVRVDGSGLNNTEVSTYSVINTKRLVIKYTLSDYYRDYVTNVVEAYLKQLIPSTTILEFEWEDPATAGGENACYSEIFGMVDDDPCVFGVLADEEGGVVDDSSINVSPSLQIISNKTTSARLSVNRKKVNKDTMVATVTSE